MAAKKTILIKPLITEKSEKMSEKLNKYCFMVHKKANKIEIKKAVEAMFNVAVESVNTLIIPAKTKSRNTKSGIVRGRKPSFKKAYVTLAEGEEIDFYGEI
ncbi:MAG: 50S ribosomal protein L23 [Haliscomenobacter sp.]|nr:50S ribosomal protein L23 [Haliscomenobacter sp.]MBK8877134.1 50S ribosomal protein L23 [Haliscomenobacter sp.]